MRRDSEPIDPKTLRKRRRRPDQAEAAAAPVTASAPIAMASSAAPVAPSIATSLTSGYVALINPVDAPCGRIGRGSSCRGFETLVRYMYSNQVIETVVNPKKDRSFRALTGFALMQMEIETEDGDLVWQTKPLKQGGDEVFVLAGTPHRVATLTQPVNLLVVQAYKYDVAMEQLEPAMVTDMPAPATEPQAPEPVMALHTADVPDDPEYVDPAPARKGLPPRRHRSKAAVQLQNHFSKYKPGQAHKAAPAVILGELNINARPTHGSEFDPSTAG